MRRRSALALLVLVGALAVAGGIYAWYRHEDSPERAFRHHLERRHEDSAERAIRHHLERQLAHGPDWVACTEDHRLTLGRDRVVFYTCEQHGGDEDGVAVCAPMIANRTLTPREARRIPIDRGFCQNFG
jgi:non-ribosomal peptide synthetase component F